MEDKKKSEELQQSTVEENKIELPPRTDTEKRHQAQAEKMKNMVLTPMSKEERKATLQDLGQTTFFEKIDSKIKFSNRINGITLAIALFGAFLAGYYCAQGQESVAAVMGTFGLLLSLLQGKIDPEQFKRSINDWGKTIPGGK